MVQAYDVAFQEWLSQGIIEKVEESCSANGHYLPHRPVIKHSNVTTKIRPVFDESAKEKDHPSLNMWLEKGSNHREFIYYILLIFQECAFGVVSDIRKAILQINLHDHVLNFLKFLWVDEDNVIINGLYLE